MKKYIFPAFLISFLASSCVKERTCECDYANGGGVASSGTITGKRKDSKRICEAQSNAAVTCYLK